MCPGPLPGHQLWAGPSPPNPTPPHQVTAVGGRPGERPRASVSSPEFDSPAHIHVSVCHVVLCLGLQSANKVPTFPELSLVWREKE